MGVGWGKGGRGLAGGEGGPTSAKLHAHWLNPPDTQLCAGVQLASTARALKLRCPNAAAEGPRGGDGTEVCPESPGRPGAPSTG